MKALLDLSVSDVHVDGAGDFGRKVVTPFRSALADALASSMATKPRYEVSNPEKRTFRGIPIVIDRPRGFEMTGVDEQGRPWSRTYTVDYGFVPNTNGGDGEGLDVFLGPNTESDRLFFVEQTFKDGTPDELKAFLGFDTKDQVAACYGAHVPREFARGLYGPFPLSILRAALRVPEVLMAEISTKARKALPRSSFADPENRAYPIHDASHTRNAAARLEQQKSSLSPAKYNQIRRNIARAARRFGIASDYNRRRTAVGARVSVRADIAHGGSVHISHHAMADRSVRVPGLVFAMDDAVETPEGVTLKSNDEGAKLVRIQIAESGHFRGHPAGPFTLDDAVFDEIVRNFNRDGLPVPIDYEHASEADPTSGNVPKLGAPAQGWIHRLETSPGKLWGLVEWLPQARDQIKGGAYRFLSPAVRFGSKDRKTGDPVGAKLTSAALTNQPFLKGMEPLMALRAGSAPMAAFAYSTHEYMPKLRAALRVPELATSREMMTQLDRLRDHFEGAAFDVSATSDGVRLADYLHPLRDIACAGRMGATWDEVFDVVEDLIDAALDKHNIEYHPGADSAPVENVNAANFANFANFDEQETEMSDQEKAMLATENAALTLKLKDAEARATAAEAKVVDLETRMSDVEKKAAEDRIGEAFDTYKDSKKLSDADRSAMAITLKHDPVLFEKLYPRISPGQRHLMATMTTGAGGAPKPSPTEVDVGKLLASETFNQTVARLMKEDSQLSYEQASSNAFQLRRRFKTA